MTDSLAWSSASDVPDWVLASARESASRVESWKYGIRRPRTRCVYLTSLGWLILDEGDERPAGALLVAVVKPVPPPPLVVSPPRAMPWNEEVP